MKKDDLKGKGKCDSYFVHHMELLFLILHHLNMTAPGGCQDQRDEKAILHVSTSPPL